MSSPREIMDDESGADLQSTDDVCRIDMVPQELLVFILSMLTLKEAVATSILSRQWRYLWTFTRRLNFDDKKFLLNVEMGAKWIRRHLDFVAWVDHVIGLNRSGTIESFRLSFNLSKMYEKHINKWLEFALSKKVERLELLSTQEACKKCRSCFKTYTFPYDMLCRDEEKSARFKHLKKLSIHGVNLSNEALEFFLSNCTLLEDLSIASLGDLSCLKIIGPLPLKRLQIFLCQHIRSVEIRDANLVCFDYFGTRAQKLVLENVPLLVDFTVGGMLTEGIGDVFTMFSSILPQLEKLTIHLFPRNLDGAELFCSSKMGNLKQLAVRLWSITNSSLLPIVNVILASPFLETFILEASCVECKFVKREVENSVGSHFHLKHVKTFNDSKLTDDDSETVTYSGNDDAVEKLLADPSILWKIHKENSQILKKKLGK